jgi:glycosyltransferase involved in cell wall biosynthesis
MINKTESEVLVSIILPTHNGEKYIKRAIESVLFQSFSDWELIIIDDGSSSKTKEILNNYLKNNKIKYLYQNDEGPSMARAKGISISKGIYLSFLDDDDYWEKDKLQKEVEFLENNKDYVLVGSGAVVVDEDGNEIMKYLLPETDEILRKKILLKNCFMQSSILIKKDSYLLSGGYSDIKHMYSEDYDLWLRIGALGKMYNIPDFLIKYTLRKENRSLSNRGKTLKRNIKTICKNRKNYPRFFWALLFGYLKISFYKIFDSLPSSSFKNRIFKFYKEF